MALKERLESIASIPAYGVMLLFAVGDVYWLWTAIKLGSFWMFAIGLIPPFMIVSIVVGSWSLIFGIPEWVYSLFG